MDDAEQVATRWLDAFGAALATGDPTLVTALFTEDGHWRDVLAMRWGISTSSGLNAIEELLRRSSRGRPRGVRLPPRPDATAPRDARGRRRG